MSAPRVFISYSWSSPEHETWVLELAGELCAAGVDTILDKWDLREGQEANAFMEQMVSDKSINKVLIVADRIYVEKSNRRAGGAGTEAQIISQELYQRQNQEKFVVVSTESDDHGDPVRPAYYTSRIFINFNDAARRAERFEQLLRWIYDKPVYQKPEIGEVPSYLKDGKQEAKLATGPLYRRALDALSAGKPFAAASARDYFELVSHELEKFRLPTDFAPEGDGFVENLDNFVPYRKEILDIVRACSRSIPAADTSSVLHKFFEDLIPFLQPSSQNGRYRDIDSDNYKFLIAELFLCSLAILIAERNSQAFLHLVSTPFYDRERADRRGNGLVSCNIFCDTNKALEIRNQKLGLNKVSLSAFLMKERNDAISPSFESIMQIDFIMYLRGNLGGASWWPHNLVYAQRWHAVFELFDRSQSRRAFVFLASILGIESKETLDSFFEAVKKNKASVPRFDYDQLEVLNLAGSERLCELP